MEQMKRLAMLGILALIMIGLAPESTQACCDIIPSFGAATIDGDYGEWNPNWPPSGKMYICGQTDYAVLAQFWLRYDCDEHILNVLVLAKNKIVIEDGEHVYLLLDGETAVSSSPTGQQQFAWIGIDGAYADGWEASFPLAEGVFGFEIHSNALDDDHVKRPCGLQYVTLCVDCDMIGIELSSFAAFACESGARLEWNVAFEINHAGYNIYRSQTEQGEYVKINSSLIVSTGDRKSATYEFIDIGARYGYYYQLEGISLDGQSSFYGPIKAAATAVAGMLDTPIDYTLAQNYPNPFNPVTSIEYTLPTCSQVMLTIYDIQGQLVKTLVNATQPAGVYSIQWDGTNAAGDPVPSGIFIYQMQAGDFHKTARMTLLK
ncbi:T9SS type A sorting domain-containing protein [candidate division KSB1 bacterium]|nr:T9SS type A sorting domain-containing protein [candidate division KSB1 bacterium]